MCARCGRPAKVCYCAHLPSLATRTRVVVLQHPRERHMPIGTARMAALCLSNAEIHTGIRFGGSDVLRRALHDPERPPVLLYPGEGATDICADPPRTPVTLVVLDGTWWQARKLLRLNPELAALPRYAFRPPAPSEYRIRREPHPSYTSTIEALVHVLGPLEGDGARFRAMLEPFRAMVETQLAFRAQPGGGRHLRAPPRPAPPRPVPALVRERAADLVCVVAEANAWPSRSVERSSIYPDELVRWTACRLVSGESIDLVVAPRHPMAAATPTHIGLARATLEGGLPCDVAHARWSAFARETDVMCEWGHYGGKLFAASGGWLPEGRLDLREVARELAGGKVGSLEELAARVCADRQPLPGEGRAPIRLGMLAAIVRQLMHDDPATPRDGWRAGPGRRARRQ
jgi:DTW domain-containing protein YfiP